jgi:hypothetical protein
VCGDINDSQLPDCASFTNSDISSSSASVDNYSTAATEYSGLQPNRSKNSKIVVKVSRKPSC